MSSSLITTDLKRRVLPCSTLCYLTSSRRDMVNQLRESVSQGADSRPKEQVGSTMRDSDEVNLWSRFWSKVRFSSGCWEWTGTKSSYGHGRFKIHGKLYSPHRISAEFFGVEIPDGYFVCHHCDNPSCVRPQHLFVGTRSDNMKDSRRKGRSRSEMYLPICIGSANSRSKMNSSQVREIIDMYSTGNFTMKEIGVLYGLTKQGVWCIVRKKVWTWL